MLAVAVAVTVSTLLAVGDGDDPSGARDSSRAPEVRSRDEVRTDPAAPQMVAIGAHGGLSRELVRRVRRTAGVRSVAGARRAHALLTSSATPGGATTRASRGYAIPLDAIVVEPRSYARVLPARARSTFERLRPGTALLGRTSASVRRVSVGATLRLAGGGSVRVVGIVDDELVRAAELVIAQSDIRHVDPREGYIVASSTDPARLIRRFARRGVRVGVMGSRPQRPAGGGIARPVEIKAQFGEFAVRLPYGDDWIQVDPGWTRRNIVTRRVPVLGRVTCHRAMLPPLVRAFREIERRNLARFVDRGDYAGCYAPRRIPGSGTLSLHAWGLAFDINASKNPQFARPRQDPRIVRILERAGFAWGGRWPTATDGMHFEYRGG